MFPFFKKQESREDQKNIYASLYDDTLTHFPFRGFFNLFLRWKSSVFKLIWNNLLIFIIAYTFLSILYRYVLINHEYAKEMFEVLCIECGK